MTNFIKQNKWIIIMILVYIIILSWVSCLRHSTFQTQTYDMAIFEQSFWQTLHGDFLFNSIEGQNHLAVHWSLFLILLIPFYFIFNSAYTLLILQTLFLASGGLAIYLLSKKLINKRIALILAAVYLLYPSLHNVNLYDFHAIAFFIPLILWFFYFWHKDKILPASIFLFLAALTKENAILAVLFIGLYILIFSKKKKKIFGAIVAVLSGIYFFLVSKVFMPALGGGVARIDQYAHLGSSLGEMIKNTFTTSILFKTVFIKAKLIYIFKLFFPVSFLSLFAPSFLILLIPGLAQNLLTNRASQFSTLYQYDSLLIPFIFIALIFTVKKIGDKKIFKYIKYLLILTVIISFTFFSNLSPFKTDFSTYKSNANIKELHKFLNSIPEDYSIAAYTNLVPHLTHRQEVYMNGFENNLVDFVITVGGSITAAPNQEIFNKYLNQYLQTGNYELLDVGGGILILNIKKPWAEPVPANFKLTPIY